MPQDDLSAKDLLLIFLDRETYEKRHAELKSQVDILQREFREHVQWANDTILHDQHTLNSALNDLRALVTTKSEETKKALTDEIKENRRGDWESRMLKVGWLIALLSPVVAIVASHLWR